MSRKLEVKRGLGGDEELAVYRRQCPEHRQTYSNCLLIPFFSVYTFTHAYNVSSPHIGDDLTIHTPGQILHKKIHHRRLPVP